MNLKTVIVALSLIAVSLSACEREHTTEDSPAPPTGEFSTSFLNGIYNVSSVCTALIPGSSNPTVSTDNYIASVSPGSNNSRFTLSKLNVGPEYVVPLTFLRGNIIDVSFNISPVDFNQNSSASGTLSASKNTFTIETKVQKLSPAIIYVCKNIYTNSKTESESR